VELVNRLRPDVVFLDIRMPGLTGIEAAREIVDLDGWQGEIVFVTAYDEYAVTAFEHGAVDYLLKPVERARLDLTVLRLQARLAAKTSAAPGVDPDALMKTLSQLQRQMQTVRPRRRPPCAGCNAPAAMPRGWWR
jgi:DNA-binding LytR/AlgR family response regulator